MKKFLAALAAVSVALSLTACVGETDNTYHAHGYVDMASDTMVEFTVTSNRGAWNMFRFRVNGTDIKDGDEIEVIMDDHGTFSDYTDDTVEDIVWFGGEE